MSMLPQPLPFRAVSVAFLLGASDGEAGAPFCPEAYYVQRSHKTEYAHGFEKARGVSEMTQQFTGSADGELQRSIDFGAELQELEDGMADEEFWRSGAW